MADEDTGHGDLAVQITRSTDAHRRRSHPRGASRVTGVRRAASRERAAACRPPETSEGASEAAEIPRWLQVAAPSTLIPALAFYFGWQVTNAIAGYFGIDPGVLGLSPEDYALRSADALFIPTGALLTAALLAVWSHALVLRHLRAHPHVYRYVTPVLVAIGAGLFLLGATAAWGGLPFTAPFLLPQLSPGVGALLVVYGLALRRRRLRVEHRLQRRAHHAGGGSHGHHFPSIVLVALLVVLSVFWAASDYATALGTGRAEATASQLGQQPGAVVYAQGRLHIEAPGVVETDLGDPGSAYRYRYSGLRLVFATAETYVLLPAVWSREMGVAVVLPRTTSIRLEFTTAGPS